MNHKVPGNLWESMGIYGNLWEFPGISGIPKAISWGREFPPAATTVTTRLVAAQQGSKQQGRQL